MSTGRWRVDSAGVLARAVAPTLVCQPSRASILTGMLPLIHGVIDNGVDLPIEIRPWWHKASLESPPTGGDSATQMFRAKLSRSPDQTPAQLREMIANYYGMISLIDHNVGRILSALDDSGMEQNTIVVFSTDHGDLLGDHGLYLKGPTPHEALLRVGLIVRGPVVPAGKRIDDPVSTLDLAATFTELGGGTLAPWALSRSLLPVIDGKESRDLALSEWHVDAARCGVPLELRTVRGKRTPARLLLGRWREHFAAGFCEPAYKVGLTHHLRDRRVQPIDCLLRRSGRHVQTGPRHHGARLSRLAFRSSRHFMSWSTAGTSRPHGHGRARPRAGYSDIQHDAVHIAHRLCVGLVRTATACALAVTATEHLPIRSDTALVLSCSIGNSCNVAGTF